jgi:hypothetical protein
MLYLCYSGLNSGYSVLIPQLFWSQLCYSGLKSGISFLGKRYFVVAMDWQSGDSDNNGSDNSGSYESPEDELGYLLHKRGARKGSNERHPNYIPEEEVW